MKIGLYNCCIENLLSSDISVAILASELAHGHSTEIIRYPDSRTFEQLLKVSQVGLDQVSFRTVTPPPLFLTDPNRPDRRYEALRAWSDELTRRYDLFINFADRIPIFSSARQSALVIQFPYDFIPSVYQMFWLGHLHSYQLRLVNSYYTQFWTRAFWEIDCPVVYPPVPLDLATPLKENLIVSVQRFDASQPHRQLKLISAFKLLKSDFPAWTFKIFGDLDENRSNQSFFTAVCEAARNVGVDVVANQTSEQETELLRHAKIFWLASEADEEVDFHPEQSDSFNLRLVQAMSAGCVPIVNNFGALSEVIRHGESGFFWNQPGELLEYTAALARNDILFQAMAQTARMRALDFRPERFVDSFTRELQKHFGITTRVRTMNRLRRLFSSGAKFLGYHKQG